MKISSSQLFALIFLFEIGSAVVVGLGMQAKQDAWLTILLGMIAGFGFYLVYSYLFRQYPDLPFTSFIQRIVGKFIGYPLAFLYILHFMYVASRVLRDFTELLITSTLVNTPMFMIGFIMITLISYAVYMGIESVARTGEILLGVILLCGVLGISFLFLSGAVKFENLTPVLENGWKPVLTTVFPQILSFPFGEMVVFTMLLPYLNNTHSGVKVGMYALTLSGLVLTVTIAIDISVLGPHTATNSMFPLLKTAQKINVGNFIQRLDSIVLTTLIIGGFFKIVVYFYAAVLGIVNIFEIKRPYCVIYFVGTIILISSIYIAGNLPEHLEIGLNILPLYVSLPLQIGIPFLLFLVVLFRNRYNKRKSQIKIR